MEENAGKWYTDAMSGENRESQEKSIRNLAGTGEKHAMENPDRKQRAEALLDMTPAALAALILNQQNSDDMELLRIMVEKNILNPAQCALLSAEIATQYEGMKQVNAMRHHDRPLVQAIVKHAAAATRDRLKTILTPSIQNDGSYDVLA